MWNQPNYGDPYMQGFGAVPPATGGVPSPYGMGMSVPDPYGGQNFGFSGMADFGVPVPQLGGSNFAGGSLAVPPPPMSGGFDGSSHHSFGGQSQFGGGGQNYSSNFSQTTYTP